MSLGNFQKILVFSAHPDDLDFACAGSVAHWIKEGKEVVYSIITDGSKGRGILGDTLSNRKVAHIRQEEQRAAAEAVGVRDVFFLDEHDGELEHNPATCKKIVQVLRSVKPDIVLGFDPANHKFDNFYLFHRDHRIAAELVFDAVYPAMSSVDYFPELNETHLPHTIHELWFYGSDQPNTFIDITSTIDTKCKALRQHKSQFRDIDAVDARVRQHARDAGKEQGAEYAETFRRITF